MTQTANEKTESLIESLGNFPWWGRESITFDNGKENAGHLKVKDALNCETFFCHAYSSFERGTVENSNGLVRQYFPKGASLVGVKQQDLNLIAHLLNTRPRKTLGYLTPDEVLSRELYGDFGSRI